MNHKLIFIFASVMGLATCADAVPVPVESWRNRADAGCRAIKTDDGELILEDGSPDGSADFNSQTLPAEAGADYRLSFQFRSEPGATATPIGGVYLRFYDAAGKKLGENPACQLRPGRPSRQETVVAATAPVGAAKMNILVKSYQSSQGKFHLSDFNLDRITPEERIKLQSAPARRDFPAPTVKAIAELQAALPAKPFRIAPPITDRTFWNTARKIPETAELISRAETLLTQPFPELNDRMYEEYRTKGINTYRTAFHDREERLRTLVLAECFEHRGRFVAAIESDLKAIMDEKTWVLPAHDKDGANFAGREITVDLGAADRSGLLVSTWTVLAPVLKPATGERIRAEVMRRLIEPYRKRLESGSTAGGFFWIAAGFNWNAVCTANVAYCATVLVDDPRERATIIAAALDSCRSFIAGFPADGYCSEGIGYWSYGFGHFLFLADVLYLYSEGKIDLFHWPKVPVIARFMTDLELHGGIYPAFADCPMKVAVKPFVQAVLAKYLKTTTMPRKSLFRGPLAQILASLPMLATANVAVPPLPPQPQSWFNVSQVLVVRSAPDTVPALSAAIKGGNNNEFHNHNDIGSYVVLCGSLMACCDPGLEVYTKRTFSPRRYESRLINSWGHPVPVVAGELQRTGAKYTGRIERRTTTAKADEIIIDLKGAYEVPSLKRLDRTLRFDRVENCIEVTDRVDFSSPQRFGTAIVTYEKFKVIDARTIEIGAGPDRVRVTVTATGGAVAVKPELIDENPDYIKTKPWRLGIDFTAPVSSGSVTVRYEPAEGRRKKQ